MSQMTAIYLNETNHMLAGLSSSAAAPDLPTLIGADGLRVFGARGPVPNGSQAADLGLIDPSLAAPFFVPASELSLKSVNFDLDALLRPHSYLVDSTTVAKLPQATLTRQQLVLLTPTTVVIDTPNLLSHGTFSFPTDTRIFIQIEGASPTDRRVIRGQFSKGITNTWQFPITAAPGGPLAPIQASGSGSAFTYYVLVLIEGQVPDVRTAAL